MKEKSKQQIMLDENIMSNIYLIRDQKVMVDRDLAKLYNVETRILNQAVRRNIDRFPEDFMFQMTNSELENWMSQFVISNSEKMGIRKKPFVFTEQGVAMLSSVLNSKTAIAVNIQIIRIFTQMRQMIMTNKDILLKLDKLEKQSSNNTKDIRLIFKYLKRLLSTPTLTERKQIGYKSSKS